MNYKKLLILIVVLIILITTAYFKLASSQKDDKVNNSSIKVSDVNEQDLKEDYDFKDVRNILLIGVDEGGYDDSRSDVMIVATIDGENKVLKLTSIMRDTLAYIPTSNTYQKMNHSYMEGGPKETLQAINDNLDLDIKDYIVFDYNTVIEAVDFIGGYPANVTPNEAKDLQAETTEKITPGQQILSGKNAINYMRIRYNSGGDEGRNQRQRDLISYILKHSKELKKTELIKFAIKMTPLVRTSYSMSDIKELLNIYEVMKDNIVVEQHSFPFEYKGTILKDGLWYAVPNTMESNVIKFQNDVLKSENYVPSERLEKINEDIKNKSNVKKTQ